MSKLIIKELNILDYANKVANVFRFSDGSNLIVSDANSKGKSSLVKSIFYALGTNLKAFPNGWEPKKYVFQLEIAIDNTIYQVKRQGSIMSIKGEEEEAVFKDFQEYSIWFQEKMGMELKLSRKDSLDSVFAYVEALLVPNYIDQDTSWNGKLYRDTFDGLGQYKTNQFPVEVIDYFLGISNNEVIKKERECELLKSKKQFIDGKINQIQKVIETYCNQRSFFSTAKRDLADLKEAIKDYIYQTNKLNKEIEKVVVKLDKDKQKLDILQQDKEELDALLASTEDRYNDIQHECIYCHSILTREQSLTRLELDDNRIAIITRRDETIQEILKQKDIINKRMNEAVALKEKFDTFHKKMGEIRYISEIETHVEHLVLSELENLSLNETKESDGITLELKELKKEIKDLKKQLKKEANVIDGEFEKLKNEISFYIDTTGLSDRKFREYKQLSGSGTKLNKDLLVIYLVYMNLISKKSKFKLPFAIDSFVKNETDSNNLAKMFKAIETHFLSLYNSQTFFSIIDDNMKYIGKNSSNKIRIDDRLLCKEKYNEVSKKIINIKG
jgi:conserved hypothetical protein